MADININEVQSSIDKVTSSMKNLVALQMAQLTKSSAEYASHIDDAADKFKKLFDLETKHIQKLKEANRLEEAKIKIEEKLSKLRNASLASDKAREQIEKRIQDLKSKKIEKEEDLIKEINKLRKEGLDISEDEVSSQEELIRFLENRKSILLKNVQITKEQYKELKKQVDIYNKHGALALVLHKRWQDIKKSMSLENVFSKLSSLTKNWISQLSAYVSIGRILERSKTAYTNYQDNMWGLGQSLKYTNDNFKESIKLILDYDESMKRAAATAARYGVDTGRVIDAMNQLSSKVLFLKKVSENGLIVNRYDYQKVEKMTEAMIAFSRSMRMDVSEAIDIYSASIRKFGMSSEKALGIMSEIQAQTISFNDMLGENAVFADEVGKAMLEIQQGTRYWVQDLMMLNTQFNAHINLLIKQGKSQKEALALAKSFQKITTEPTSELTKYNVGRGIKQKYHASVKEAQAKGLSEEEQILAGAKSLGYTKEAYVNLTSGKKISKEDFKKLSDAEKEFYYKVDEYMSDAFKSKAETIYGATVKNRKFASEKGESDYFAEVGAEVSSGITGNIQYWLDRFNKSGWKLEVAQKQGFGQNLDEAAELNRMLMEVKARGWDKEEGLTWESVIKAIKTEDFDKLYGGLSENGEVSQKLLESFNSLSEEQKKLYKGLTDEEKAKDYRQKEIENSIREMSKKKEDNRQFDALGNINETNKGIKESMVNKFNETITSIDSIKNLLSVSPLLMGASALLNFGSSAFGLFKLSKMFKNLNKMPTNIGGSVANAVSKTKISPRSVGAFGVGETLPKASLFKDLSGYNFNKTLATSTKIEIPKTNGNVSQWYNDLKNSSKLIKTSSETLAKSSTVSSEVLSKSSNVSSALAKANALSSKSSNVMSKVLPKFGKLGGKLLSKVAAPIAVGSLAYTSGKKLMEGDIIGSITEGLKAALPITEGIDILLDFRKDYLNKQKSKEELFEDFNKVTTSVGILPENIDKAIDDYVNKSQGLSEEAMEDLKKSLKDSYAETYKEAQKADTKNPEAILLRKKLEYGQNNQAALAEEQIKQEKEAYEQLDDIGKVIANQEKMFKLHEDWFNFNVEVETRKLLSDASLSKNDKLTMMKGMMRGSAGISRIEKAVDASGVETWKVVRSKSVTAANKTGMLD